MILGQQSQILLMQADWVISWKLNPACARPSRHNLNYYSLQVFGALCRYGRPKLVVVFQFGCRERGRWVGLLVVNHAETGCRFIAEATLPGRRGRQGVL